MLTNPARDRYQMDLQPWLGQIERERILQPGVEEELVGVVSDETLSPVQLLCRLPDCSPIPAAPGQLDIILLLKVDVAFVGENDQGVVEENGEVGEFLTLTN